MTGMEQPTFLPVVPAVLTVADLDCTKGDEPLIRDLRLAEGLEMANRHAIRRIIKKHEEALESFGILISHRDAKLGAGRPSSSYYLNKRQALYTIAKSDTPVAAAITVQMVEVFDAYKSGVLVPARRMTTVREHERRTSTKLPHALKLQTNIDRLEAIVCGINKPFLSGDGASCPVAAMAHDVKQALSVFYQSEEGHHQGDRVYFDLVERAVLDKLSALTQAASFYTASSTEGALFQVAALSYALHDLQDVNPEDRHAREGAEAQIERLAAQIALFLEQASGLRREDYHLGYCLDRRILGTMILHPDQNVAPPTA